MQSPLLQFCARRRLSAGGAGAAIPHQRRNVGIVGGDIRPSGS